MCPRYIKIIHPDYMEILSGRKSGETDNGKGQNIICWQTSGNLWCFSSPSTLLGSRRTLTTDSQLPYLLKSALKLSYRQNQVVRVLLEYIQWHSQHGALCMSDFRKRKSCGASRLQLLIAIWRSRRLFGATQKVMWACSLKQCRLCDYEGQVSFWDWH
jgi:hypothetical protein